MNESFLKVLGPVLVILISDLLLGEGIKNVTIEHHWSTWSHWSLCKRYCSSPLGEHTRERRCQTCDEKSCQTVEADLCSESGDDSSLMSNETASCYNGHYCDGHGIYTGQFTNWKAGECRMRKLGPNPKCTDRGVQTFTRECKATGKTRELGMREFRCSDPVSTDTIEKRECDIDCRYQKPCYFSEWSNWKCSDCLNTSKAYKERACIQIIKPCECQDEAGDKDTVQVSDCSACVKQWSAWSEWSNVCSSFECDAPGEYRNRTCEGYGRECECQGAIEASACASEWKACSDLDQMNLCMPVNGQWSEWFDFKECSKDCGFSFKIQKRLCNNPKPSLAGRYCYGPSMRVTHCSFDSKWCPVDGGFSPWTEWSCDTECGVGRKFRRRLCDNPVPMFEGKSCNGSVYQEDWCVNFDGDDCMYDDEEVDSLPYSLKYLAMDYLKATHHSYRVDEGRTLTLECANYLTRAIGKFYDNNPSLDWIEWLQNGRLVVSGRQDIRINRNSSMTIKTAEASHSGVYICRAKLPGSRNRSSRLVVDLFSLAVDVKSETIAYNGDPFKLGCQAETLTSLFGKLAREWYKDGARIRNESFQVALWTEFELSSVDSLAFEALSYADSGTYDCRIRDLESGREWQTNRVRLRVTNKHQVSLEKNQTFWSAAGVLCGAILACQLLKTIWLILRRIKHR